MSKSETDLCKFVTYFELFSTDSLNKVDSFNSGFDSSHSWKDLKCPFRTDGKTKLNVLPTLARWGTEKRLEGDQCLDVELVEMLVTDEDEWIIT